jgi:hypothetical protein
MHWKSKKWGKTVCSYMESKKTSKKRRSPYQKLYGRGKIKPMDKDKEEQKVSGSILPSVDANRFRQNEIAFFDVLYRNS